MIVTIRHDVDLRDIKGSLPESLAGIPMELALPYRLVDFIETLDRLGELEEYIARVGINMICVHAAQGSLITDDFMAWARPTQDFAAHLSARYVVYHPNRTAKTRRLDMQIIARQHLKELERAVPGVPVYLESFSGSDRIYTPEEIVAGPWPLVLDLSHVDPGRAFALIEASPGNIGALHVSEVAWFDKYRKQQSHMPAGPTCEKAFRLLKKKRWDGVMTLEYLPDFHDQMHIDRARIEAEWGNK